jgi:hypothetical protein
VKEQAAHQHVGIWALLMNEKLSAGKHREIPYLSSIVIHGIVNRISVVSHHQNDRIK